MVSSLFGRVKASISWIRSKIQSGGRYAWRHKILSVLGLLIVFGLSYWGYTAWSAAHTSAAYTLAIVHQEPLEETITGSGQISASHTLSLSPKASGTVASVRVTPGQHVTAGTVIATLESTDAQKSVRDAKLSFDAAKLTYAKQQAGADAVASALNTSASALSDIEEALLGMDPILHGFDIPTYAAQSNVTVFGKLAGTPSTKTIAQEYAEAEAAYVKAKKTYDATPRTASVDEATALLEVLASATQKTSQVSKDALSAARAADKKLQADNHEPAVLPTYLNSLSSYSSTLNTDITSLASAKSSLSGSVIDSASDDITYERAKNAYQDALDALSDYTVRAPFAGTIATVDVQPYDEAGTGTKVATLITNTEYAELSLSETDTAMVAVGQKATLTFDAIDGLTVHGTVVQIDPAGTVSSGVVSYTAKIALDTTESAVKPGMTVNATIVTASKEDALVVPSSALKTQNGKTYVEVVERTAPAGAQPVASSTRRVSGIASSTRTTADARTIQVSADQVTLTRVFVETGLISDTMTEIVSGLKSGDSVVTQTMAASGKPVAQTNSIFGLLGGNRSAAGGARTQTGGTAPSRAAGGTGAPPAGIGGQ